MKTTPTHTYRQQWAQKSAIQRKQAIHNVVNYNKEKQFIQAIENPVFDPLLQKFLEDYSLDKWYKRVYPSDYLSSTYQCAITPVIQDTSFSWVVRAGAFWDVVCRNIIQTIKIVSIFGKNIIESMRMNKV
jgi:hypothetical protein